jgi:hypothetical protein
MSSYCSRGEEECLRETTRKDFQPYREYYGIAPPEHEPTIDVGDLGRFTPEGEFIRLGCMFESSEQTLLEKTHAERWLGVPRPSVGDVVVSEELIFDPFISRTTGWEHVADDRMQGYTHPNIANVDLNSSVCDAPIVTR